MTVIPLFKPHSRAPRVSGAAAELRQLPTVKYTHSDVAPSPETSPGVSGRLLAVTIAAGVFTVVGLYFWWLS